ncbi:transglycosylase domain-containing protein [Geodermatophilus sp. SYSU D00691]
MPSHDETSPVAPRAGSVRRPPPARTRSTGGGGEGRAAGAGRPRAAAGGAAGRSAAASGRGRTTAGRTSSDRRAAAGSGGGGRPPGSRPPGGRPTGGGSGGGRPGGRKGKPPRTKKQRRRRRLKIALGTLLGLFVLLGVFVGVVYASTDVPDPNSVQNAQTTVIYYGDGQTEMARLGDENRTNVRLEQVSEAARNAVLAAENRSFYSDPGISFTGIVRAAWNNLTGGSTQGGSTITQQYVKNAFLTQEQTFSRKFQELFLAIKLDNNYSKNEILENYLNTIYFGRGAYGIEAAANTYFGVPAAQLTAQQGAVLAVLIRSPSRLDPENDPQGAQERWANVLDAMVEEGWLSEAERSASAYPPVLPRATATLGIPTGPEGLIVSQVIAELEARGYPEDQIRAGGLRITTTIDPRMQSAALTAVQEVMEGEPDNLRQALVSVDPRSGAVRAYYGGPIGAGEGAIDYAQARRQPGSSMKPYVLAAALERGIGVNARRDGSSPQTFPDREAPVRNSGGASCGACTLKEAITRSLNTTFYGLAYEVGPDTVRELALRATGMPETWPDNGGLLDGKRTLSAPETGNTGSSIGIGEYEMRPIDQAVGFATLANGGVRHAPFFVARVTDNEGALLMENTGDAGDQAVPADVANDVTFAIEGVADYSDRPLAGGRPVASKTGTQGLDAENNSDAWMVGYTPSLSTAVWMGSDSLQPIVDARGRIIYGAGLPGEIWQEFMNTALEGSPEEPLPREALIDGDTGEGVPAPETSAPTTASSAPEASTSSAPPPSTPSTSTTTSSPPPPEEDEEEPVDEENPNPLPNPVPGPGQGGAPAPGDEDGATDQ